MRILVISPGSPASLEHQPPLGLGYIISYLKHNGFPDTRLVDLYETSQRRLKKTLRTFQPDLVGIQCVTPTRHRSLEVARLAKDLAPKAPVVLGGIHATFLSRQILEAYPQVDYVVRGEGEQTMLELARAVEAGSGPGEILGVSCRRNGAVVENPPRPPLMNLDQLPFPQYVEHRLHIEGGGKRSAAVITARGCGAACRYCAVPNFWGRPRFRSPANVVDEIEHLVKAHGVGYIRVVDDTFSVDMERAAAICDEILRRGLKVEWRCATRADCVSEELLHLMRRAGCVRVSYGIESGSPKILKAVHKLVDLEQIENACRWAKEAGMIIEACFMVGNRGETRETIEQTKRLIRRLRPDEFCVSNAVYLFPGTPLYRYAKKQGFIDDGVWLSDRRVVPYTAEHPASRLSDWQMELVRECGASRGTFGYLAYAFRIARRMPPKALLKSGFSFLKANLGPVWARLTGKGP